MQVLGVLLSDERLGSYNSNKSTLFDITFDQSVSITEYFYPSFSLAEFFSSLGGTLGLWLGIGLIQLFEYGLNIVLAVQTCVAKKQ